MANKFSSSKNRKIFAYGWRLGLLLFFLGTLLSACGDVTLNFNCMGTNVFCRTPIAAPNSPAIIATANAITNSQPSMSDLLSQEDNNRWGNHPSYHAGCFFQNGTYFVAYDHTPASTYGCDSTTLHYGNDAIQMDVTLISGDSAGILFRVDPTFSEMYAFDITSRGEAQLELFGENGMIHVLIPATVNSAIHGVGKKNTLLLIARDDDFQILVNGAFIGEAHDSALTTGSVGMNVADYSGSAVARFANLKIYQI